MSYQLGSMDSDGRTELYADPGEREVAPRFRGLIAGLVAVVVVGVFAGGLCFTDPAHQRALDELRGSRRREVDVERRPLARYDQLIPA